jgi:hypothetical protein
MNSTTVARLLALGALALLPIACSPGGSSIDPASGIRAIQSGGPAGGGGATAPAAPAAGGGGGGRFEIGAPLGLYIDPNPPGNAASGAGSSVTGSVVVTYTRAALAPAGTTVTVNGTPMHDQGNSFFSVDPAGPQPVVVPGQPITLVASLPASKGVAAITRTLVLPCPSDIDVTSTPAAGSSLAGLSSVHISSTANLNLNASLGLPNSLPVQILGGQSPRAIMFGYDTTTRAVSGTSGTAFSYLGLGSGLNGFDSDVSFGTPTSGNAYIMRLTWPGTYTIDGQSGGLCGMSKTINYTT